MSDYRSTSAFDEAVRVACRGDANVLILGPTGSGKTSLARKLHEAGMRRSRAFVTVNLASLHDGTFESELFGHERGAFTGADSRRIGRLEAAQGGTVFLDEVGELSLRQQARLLEFLQSRTLSPVGSNREIRLDVRVISATNRDLRQLVSRGEFREDLYHRLRVISISLRSLNERWREFGDLVHHVLSDVCRNTGKSVLRVSEGVAHRLETHDWPGNLRELRNVLEYAVLACDGQEIRPSDLPPWFEDPLVEGVEPADAGLGVAQIPMGLNFSRTLRVFEREYLGRALRRNGGKVSATARCIGVSKATLLRRLKTHQLRRA